MAKEYSEEQRKWSVSNCPEFMKEIMSEDEICENMQDAWDTYLALNDTALYAEPLQEEPITNFKTSGYPEKLLEVYTKEETEEAIRLSWRNQLRNTDSNLCKTLRHREKEYYVITVEQKYINIFEQRVGLKYYSGELGEFLYNISEFEIQGNILKYIGNGDPAKDIIPKGLISCNCMFSSRTDITIAPDIPEGVIECDSMFRGCMNLKLMPGIPNSCKSAKYMFYDCVSLHGKVSVPDTLEDMDYMFCNTAIEEVIHLPEHGAILDSTFRGCKKLIRVAAVEDVEDCGNTFEECCKLEAPLLIKHKDWYEDGDFMYKGTKFEKCTEEQIDMLARGQKSSSGKMSVVKRLFNR